MYIYVYIYICIYVYIYIHRTFVKTCDGVIVDNPKVSVVCTGVSG